MTEHAQDGLASEKLAALAKLLDQHATGLGRITPRPRGARLSPEIRELLEEAVAAVANSLQGSVEGSLDTAGSLVYGNGCYAIGRHADAAEVYSAVLEREPSHADARFNLGLVYLRLKIPEYAVREFTELLVRSPYCPRPIINGATATTT